MADYLAAMVGARPGNYLAFFPSYSYMETVRDAFAAQYPDIPLLIQQSALDEAGRADFLAKFQPDPEQTLLGFAVLGGVFGEGVDLAGTRLIGAAIVGPGLPQVGPRQEQLRDYFERTRGSGFDYAYRYPGMNKVLQAAGRVIRTPEDRGRGAADRQPVCPAGLPAPDAAPLDSPCTGVRREGAERCAAGFWQGPAGESPSP